MLHHPINNSDHAIMTFDGRIVAPGAFIHAEPIELASQAEEEAAAPDAPPADPVATVGPDTPASEASASVDADAAESTETAAIPKPKTK